MYFRVLPKTVDSLPHRITIRQLSTHYQQFKSSSSSKLSTSLEKNKRKVIDFVKSLQNSDGSFIGSPDDDKEETDTRFSFCAIATLKLLDSLDEIDTSKTVDHIKACQNFDGAFGVRVGSESHAGQVFCCVGTLALLQKLEIIDQELLGWWLADRQVSNQLYGEFSFLSFRGEG